MQVPRAQSKLAAVAQALRKNGSSYLEWWGGRSFGMERLGSSRKRCSLKLV